MRELPKGPKGLNIFDQSGKHGLYHMRGTSAWLGLLQENNGLLGVAFLTAYLMKSKHCEEDPCWPFLST